MRGGCGGRGGGGVADSFNALWRELGRFGTYVYVYDLLRRVG